jgi:hypothetical protein
MTKHKIASVGKHYRGTEFVEFYGNESLTPFDIVIIDPTHVLLTSPGIRRDHNNFFEIKGNSVFEFTRVMTERRSELQALLANGKLIITFLSPPYNINYFASAGPTGHVGNYFWLPIHDATYIKKLLGVSGKGLRTYGDEKENHLFSNYYRAFKDDLYFDAYLNLDSSRFPGDVFISNATQHVAGFSVNVEQGVIVFLPYYPSTSENDEKFVGVISHIAKQYFGAHIRTESPAWAGNYEIENQIAALEANVDQLEGEKQYLEDFKGLLYEKGDFLQLKVVEAFKLMGFAAETVPGKNTDFDVVLQSAEGHAIAEVEGKDDEAIRKDKIDQLLSAINQAAEDTGAFAKGILVGNHFRLTDPNERKDPFTPTVLSLAKQYKYALITTVDLFSATINILEHPDDESYKKACRVAILKTSGSVVIFPKPDLVSRESK